MGHSKADFINTFGGDLGPKLFDESRDYTRKFQDVKNDPTGLLMQQAGEEFWDAAIKEVLGGYSSYDEWKQAQGFAPGGLALTMYPAITPLVVDPGAQTRIAAHLTKNGVPYYAGALAPHFSGGYANVELYANGVKIAEKMANAGAGDWAGLALFDVTAPSTIGPWAITLRYKEKVDNPVTRLPETNSAATSFVIQVGPTGTGQPIVIIPTRFGTLLRVLAQIAVQGVERIFAIPQAPTFFANETMKIVAYIAFKGVPVKDYTVAFTVDNQEIGDMKTDEKGYAYMPFRIPKFGETIQQQFTRTTNGSATIKSTIQGEKRHRLCVKVKTEEGDVEDCQMIVVSSEAVTGETAPVGYEAYLASLRAQFAAGTPSGVFTPTGESPLPTFPVIGLPETPVIPEPGGLPETPVPGRKDSFIIIPAIPKPPGVTFPVEVEIDRKNRGEPPIKVKADPGKHQIVVSLKGFAPIQQSIQLAAGETITVPGLNFRRGG